MSKDIIIELTKDQGTDVKGTRYGVPSVAAADRLYDAYKVISHVDGEPYEAPAPKTTKPRSAPKPKATKAPAPSADVPVPVDEPAGDAT